ncbi:MAG: hypothetical protein DRN55_04140 [Thermoplasmata archaeon]|nr:MAG: hypothetical protein DRN55_04140 [Thermoplasmata archaeon]
MSQQLWFQNYYRVRKKVLAIGNKYWIEDQAGNIIGFSKQKILKLKEDIRIYTDESMKQELFRIKQQQIIDLWGNFALIDSATEQPIGYIRRKAAKSTFAWDEWEMYDANNQLIGKIEESKGRGLMRKYMPGGKLIPEKMTISLGGRPVAEVNQKFKVIGDIWELNCTNLPPNVDRRPLLGALVLMAMIERQHK